MADADDRGGDGLPVQDGAGAEGQLQAEALPGQAGEHLQLNLPHDLKKELTGLFLPAQVELGVLLLQLPQQGQDGVGVPVEQDLTGEYRLQRRSGQRRLGPQRVPGAGMGQAGDGAQGTGRSGLGQFILVPGIQPQLVGLV